MQGKVKVGSSCRLLSRSSQGDRRTPGACGATKSTGTGSFKGVGMGRNVVQRLKQRKKEESAEFGNCLSLGCCNRILQTGWLKQQTFISHSFWISAQSSFPRNPSKNHGNRSNISIIVIHSTMYLFMALVTVAIYFQLYHYFNNLCLSL